MGKLAEERGELAGSHRQTMDDRGRIPVPTRVMGVLRKLCGVTDEADAVEVVISITKRGTIGIFPGAPFYEKLDELKAKAKAGDKVAERDRLRLLNYMELVTLDKQNRFKVPTELATKYGLTKEVFLVGSDDCLEVMVEAAWNKRLDEDIARDHAQLEREAATL